MTESTRATTAPDLHKARLLMQELNSAALSLAADLVSGADYTFQGKDYLDRNWVVDRVMEWRAAFGATAKARNELFTLFRPEGGNTKPSSVPSPSTGGEPDPRMEPLARANALVEASRARREARMQRLGLAGGEPATDSTGLAMREALTLIKHSRDFHRLLPSSQRIVTDALELAAREPAPVARELDADAERQAFQVAFPIPEGVEWDGHYGNDRYISRYQMHEVFEYNLRWAGWLAARQATAESAPASAAPRDV